MAERKYYTVKTKENINFIFNEYESVLKKFCWLSSYFDNDLYSEERLALLKCIHNFKFNEKEFVKIYEKFE